MLSDSPPERDLPWSEAGIEGAWRFVQRLWRLFGESENTGDGGEDIALARKLHRAIAVVAADIEALGFNKAVAKIHALANDIEKAEPSATRAKARSEEHTSELQSLMRISYAVFCLKKTNTPNNTH